MNPTATPANDEWQAWVDGTAVPNPGRLAIGGILISPSGVRSSFSEVLSEHGCNNEAEVHAIAGLLAQAAKAGAQRIVIYSDSRFAVDCLNGLDDTAIDRLGKLLTHTRTTMNGFASVSLRWLPRHHNADTDQLARAALGLLPKPSPKPQKRSRR